MKTLDEGSFKSDGDNVVICVGQSIATINQIDLLRIALERIGASGKALEEQLKDVDYRGRLIDGDELYRTINHSETISKEDVLDMIRLSPSVIPPSDSYMRLNYCCAKN